MSVLPSSTSNITNSSYTPPVEQLSDEEFWKLAAESARSTATAHTPLDEHLVCTLGQRCCIVSLNTLYKIVAPPLYFSRLPLTPDWVPGLSAWHGEIIAVVDLQAYLLGTPAVAHGKHDDGMLLVAPYDDLALGLFVTGVKTALHLAQEQPLIPFTLHTSGQANQQSLRQHVIRGVTKIGEDEILVLDTPMLFADIAQSLRMTASHE